MLNAACNPPLVGTPLRLSLSKTGDFAKKTTQKTVVVLDNAPIHKSRLFQSKIAQWEEENDLLLFFILPYSLELNLIEIFWKK
jgi:transposase